MSRYITKYMNLEKSKRPVYGTEGVEPIPTSAVAEQREAGGIRMLHVCRPVRRVSNGTDQCRFHEA